MSFGFEIIETSTDMYHFIYKDSIGQEHKIGFEPNEYNSVMEMIWDKGYEDWGDCRGRAWCGTCQVLADSVPAQDELDKEERICLNQMDNRMAKSRLSCQIMIDKDLDKKKFEFMGD